MRWLNARIMMVGLAACIPAAASGSSDHEKAVHLSREGLQAALGIPSTMAEVKYVYMPPGQRRLRYVLIEDVHDNPEAQGKIAAILLYAHHHWGSRQAFVEGAFGVIGPPPFPIFTAERGERSVNELLRRGMFSGGELAAALASQSPETNRVPFDVIGMDDPQLYKRQLLLFEGISFFQSQALSELEALSSHLGSREAGYMRRLILLRLGPKDYAAYERMHHTSYKNLSLAQEIERCEDYYRLTDLRSQKFAERLQTRVGLGPSLLVMGGYHTSALTRILKARHDSFLVLSPHVTQSSRRAEYQERLLESLRTLQRFSPNSPYSSPAGYLRLTLAHKRDTI